MVVIKTSSELDKLRESARIVALVHRELKKLIVPGITTMYLDKVTREIISQEGGVPGFLGYMRYEYAICASVNNVIVHGFPNVRKLEEGDVVSIDVGVLKDNYFGDAAFTVGVGEIGTEVQDLIHTTKLALNRAILNVREGTTTGTIGRVIEECARSDGYSVVRNYIGHGIGRNLHEDPQIFNYGRDIDGIRLKSGMCICIEPMLCIGTAENHRLKDGWSVVTNDGKLSAHEEHQVIVHKDYGEIISI